MADITFGVLFGHAALTDPHGTGRLVIGTVYSLFLIGAGFLWFKTGSTIVTVSGEGWADERAQVDSWLAQLRRNDESDNIVEIKESTFVRGKRTYRFLKTPDCWVIGIFPTGYENKFLIDYRIRELSAVTLEQGPDSTIGARIKGTLIPRGQKVTA